MKKQNEVLERESGNQVLALLKVGETGYERCLQQSLRTEEATVREQDMKRAEGSADPCDQPCLELEESQDQLLCAVD